MKALALLLLAACLATVLPASSAVAEDTEAATEEAIHAAAHPGRDVAEAAAAEVASVGDEVPA